MLKGIRIIDLSRLLPGPYASMLLGDLEAEIIKVEEPDRAITCGIFYHRLMAPAFFSWR